MVEMADRIGAKHDKQKLDAIRERLGGRLNSDKIEAAVQRDRAMFRRHGSRVDGGMVVATLAFAALVFVVGVIVGFFL